MLLQQASLYSVVSCTAVYGLQVDPLYVSAIVLTGRVWDAITDPIIGNLSLRTKTRLGRLRPWCVTVCNSMSLCVVVCHCVW